MTGESSVIKCKGDQRRRRVQEESGTNNKESPDKEEFVGGETT